MKPEECGICHEQVSFSQTIHVMVHTHSEEGVLDYYVCQSCYEDDLRPLFDVPESESDTELETDSDTEPDTDSKTDPDSEPDSGADLDAAEP